MPNVDTVDVRTDLESRVMDRIAALEGKVKVLESDIESLQSQVSGLESA